jgi:lambda repressor-like predicted transcriptional regulator
MSKTDLIEKHPADIKAELEKAGASFASIGRDLGMDRRLVSEIVLKSGRVYEAIAAKIQQAA